MLTSGDLKSGHSHCYNTLLPRMSAPKLTWEWIRTLYEQRFQPCQLKKKGDLWSGIAVPMSTKGTTKGVRGMLPWE